MRPRQLYRPIYPAIMLAVLMAVWSVAAAGCGQSAARETLGGFLAAAKEQDCVKMVEYVDLDADAADISPGDLIKACRDEGGLGNVVSWRFTGEKIEGDTAVIGVELTVKSGDEEKANTGSFNLVRKDGIWKLTAL